MSGIWPVLGSVVGVVSVMMLGSLCRQRGWIPSEVDQAFANLITKILLPAYFFSRILAGPSLGSVGFAWLPAAFGFLITALGFGIGLLFARSVGKKFGLVSDSQQRAFALCVGICNYGYIPLPLAEKFYPDALVPLILHNVGVELALWSFGVLVISGRQTGGWLRVLLSPPFVAVVLACVLHSWLGSDALPAEAMVWLGALGDCAIPLGLLLSGAVLSDFMAERSWLRSAAIPLVAMALRQFVLPLIMLGSAFVLSVDEAMQQVVTIQAAMPSAVFSIVLVRLYGRDTVTAIQVILGTSVAGVLLIPLWLVLGRAIFGF